MKRKMNEGNGTESGEAGSKLKSKGNERKGNDIKSLFNLIGGNYIILVEKVSVILFKKK